VGNFGLLNPVWKYSPTTNEWTWMGGSSLISEVAPYNGVAPGQYGTYQQPGSGNIPSGRGGSRFCTDIHGNQWLFGGDSYANTGVTSYYNDLWEFNSITNQWVWMSGSSSPGQTGIYGTLGSGSFIPDQDRQTAIQFAGPTNVDLL
jgi:N-acetylneuraminic acid mutarotase